MKRTNPFKFALLGATALTLVACGEAKEEALVYKSVEECVKAGEQDAAVCKAEFAKAEKLHTEVAPRYNSSNDCYSDFGYDRCRRYRTSSGTSMWLPFMVGYMLAPRIGGRSVYSQPLYRPANDPNRYYTARSGGVGRVGVNGRTQVAKAKVSRPQARTRTVARGGFGARAAGRSSGG